MTDLTEYSLTLLRATPLVLQRGISSTAARALFVSIENPHSERDTSHRLHHEYDLRAELRSPWAARPTGLLHQDNKLVLMLDDPGGDLLRERCKAPLPVDVFLRLASAISSALSGAHGQGLVHCDLSPDNILVTQDAGACLTGFGCAFRDDQNHRESDLRYANQGIVEYMAPEVCAQMNRRIDARADLYSLGCTFYEMLTGTLPVAGDDRLALVHAHLARRPALPSELVAGLPRQIEMIIMKLLAKDPEERYQSAASLTADLERCETMWQAGEWISLFPLDIPALSGRQHLSQQLFGREGETSVLRNAYERTAAGEPSQLILVNGYSGAGKTSLVSQWIKQMGGSSHLFAAGTCEQVNSSTPYVALIQIIEQLVRPILGEDQQTFLVSQRRLLDALGAKARMLWTVIPDLKLILGDKFEDDGANVPVDRERFLTAAADLIKVFCKPERPLILFFDDLQWSDEGTMSALGHLSEKSCGPYLLLIGAYRCNEVGPDHPLRQLMASASANLQHLELAPLDRDDTARLIASTLQCSLEQVNPVVDLVDEKTGGNPFFATQFAIELAQEGLIEFEHQSSLHVRDLDRIRAKAYTDNVVDLMLRRLDRLGAATQAALRHLSCLGSFAPVATIASAMDCSEAALQEAMADALRSDLVYRAADGYHFRHDRFREAAYASMTEHARIALHLEIGRRMIARIADEQSVEDVFDIVSQINFGIGDVAPGDERRRFAQLNVMAGRRAKAATAYASALTYFVAAAALLSTEPEDESTHWVEFYLADCECLLGMLGSAEERLLRLGAREISMALRAELTRLITGLYTAQSRADLGMEAGLDYLRRLGLHIEARPTDVQVDEAFADLQRRIGNRTVADLAHLPTISDPLWHSAIEALADMIPPALFIDVNLLDIILLHVANLSVEHGLCDASSFGFVFLNFVYGARYGDYSSGYEFGKLAIQVIDRCGQSRYKSRVYMRFGSLVIPWTRPLDECMPFVEQAYRISSEIGNLVFDVSSARNVASLLLLAGAPLDEVLREAERGFSIASASRFALYLGVLGGQIELVKALRESGIERHTHSDEAAQDMTTSVAFSEWTYRLQARFMFGQIDAALEAEQMAQPSLSASTTILEVIDYHFYGALTRADAYASAVDENARRIQWAALAMHSAPLAAWAQTCPVNFAGRSTLVAARIAQLDGLEHSSARAEHLYDEAIRHSKANRFLQIEAVANELAASFYLARGLEEKARTYLRDARRAYAQWGANAKAAELDRRYGWLRDTDSALVAPRPEDPAFQQLDIAAVIKVSNALASEIVLPRLIETLVTTALQHAGGRRCVLALAHSTEMRIEAQARVWHERIDVSVASLPISSADVATSVVHAVVRTGKHVVLDNACESGAFVRDEYVQRSRSRSIVCTPLLKQAKLIGVLYVENELAVGTFTGDKTALLSVLGSQAAIAVDNARLYEDLIEQNRARSKAEQALSSALANLARMTRVTTMGELVVSIVHEVSQPLMAIQTSIGAALRWLDRPIPEVAEARIMLTNVAEDSLRASQVIKSLRAMAKQSEPTFSLFDLGEAVFEVLTMLRGQIQDHHVEVIHRPPDPVLVNGDRIQVQQVVLNLIMNATEAMSTLDERPRVLTVACEALHGQRALVRVEDTGPGLAPEVAGRLFEPFVTTKQSGMGMGLSICRSIAEAHGGELTVAPGEPHGAVFSLNLPAGAAVEQDDTAQQ
ncbi:Predicted ATPase [Paraburkholderia fungorum]|uniref:histidine kinase n=1 Tax=Paraburkholderia fungorum TaxID=134537 RepID=A0A1H1H691_9BURK|nr:AAA family ATPase [Paraburkholderia fungorum]SDR20889.1 Predicted ATPase [Paraburkholderia fungorum]